jgi:hypothetical protein
MKSEKESTKLNQTISSKGDIDRKVEEVLSEVEKMPDFEVPVGKIFLNPDEISNTEWKKENMETFQIGKYDYTELDEMVDKKMNDDYKKHIRKELLDEIYNEAVNVRLDYEQSPSEESGSLVRIHQDSKFLKEK